MEQPIYYEVEVPAGMYPGMAFQANIGGQLMMVTTPEGVAPGELIQVAGSSPFLPTVAGVPVVPGANGHVAPGHPVPTNAHILGAGPEVAYVEVDEISPAGWLCLIIGCFACPGLNLLGLCMRERRLVPIATY